MKIPSATEAALLIALGSQKLSGRQLAKVYEEENGKSISYGTLYTTMGRLKQAGWVEQLDGEDADGRVRSFQVSGEGAKSLQELRAFFGGILGLPQRKAI